MAKKRLALGRGIASLIPESPKEEEKTDFFMCNIDEILPNPYQPRVNFDEQALKELSLSIKESGVIQPLLIRVDDKGQYFLIAGERRLKASRLAGLKEVPVILKEVDEKSAFELSIIENIQRRDLNAIEEAHAYKKLIEKFKITQEELSKVLGKERSTIANYLRLNNLSDTVKQSVIEEKIFMGHARAILSEKDEKAQDLILKEVLEKGLSVRQTENFVKSFKNADKKLVAKNEKNIQLKDISLELSKLFFAKFKVLQKKDKRQIQINFDDNDKFEEFIKLLKSSLK